MLGHSVRNQLKLLFGQLCYRSTGERILPAVSSMAPAALQNRMRVVVNPDYRVEIAQQVYNRYRDENFKYCEQGLTPKIIAEQMSVHLGRFVFPDLQTHKDMQWDINEFGIFEVRLTLNYKHKITNMMMDNLHVSERCFVDLEEFSRICGKGRRSEQVNCFDFIVSGQGLTVGEFLQARALESKAKVVELYNRKPIRRRVFYCLEGTQQMSQQVDFMRQHIFGANAIINTYPYEQLYPRSSDSKQRYHISCSPEQTIFFEERLPMHTLHKQIPRINLPQLMQKKLSDIQDIRDFMSFKYFPRKVNDCSRNHRQAVAGNVCDLSTQFFVAECLIRFDDMLDDHEFGEIQDFLVSLANKCTQESEELHKKLWKTVEVITGSLNKPFYGSPSINWHC